MADARRFVGVVSALGACLLLLVAGGASAFLMTLDVVVVTDRTSYLVGDYVNATVYVLNGGVPSDADSVSLTATAFGIPFRFVEISLSRTAIGTYRGTLPVTSNLTPEWSGGVNLRAQATVGYLTDTASTSVYVPGPVNLQACLSLSPSEAAPGDTVQGKLTVTFNGAPRAPDEVNVSVRVSNPFFYRTLYPPTTAVATGVYAFAFTVPPSLNASATLYVTGTATILTTNGSYGFSDFVSVPVRLPDPFLVWYNATSWSANQSYLDVWVATMTGSPVSGAKVTLYPLLGPLSPPGWPAVQNATTDAVGRARFSISVSGLDYFSFWGFVTRGNANESFSGGVRAPPHIRSPFPGFTLLRNNQLDVFEPGETAVLNYTALFNYVPLNGRQLFYDVHNATALIAYGSVRVSRTGSFGIQFPMPRDAATLDIGGEMPNTGWSVASDSVQPAMRLAARVGPFQVGATTQLTASLPESGGPWDVTVGFYPYNLAAYPDLRPEWSAASDFAGTTPGVDVGVAGGSSFQVNFTLPAFLPSDRMYYLDVTATPTGSGSSPDPSPLHYVFKGLVYVGGAPGVPLEALLIVSLLAALGVVGVAVVIVCVLRQRPRQPAAPSRP